MLGYRRTTNGENGKNVKRKTKRVKNDQRVRTYTVMLMRKLINVPIVGLHG